MGMAVSSTSRCIKRVSEVLAALRPLYIHMPVQAEAITTSQKFFEIASFPRVVGCIDGTHIRIQSPGCKGKY